ncbi:ATP-binding protein [Paenibacillus psychroresistens]|uniref:ATP-binding protein n=1 Tax=Paenibacillus psychroresistens TaxID=1778678 RepID=A0A6B8RNL5_9BACL|nr:ATP-binding protein [Paenibacillus psychroresistens]QGQ97920.1 ATP-binding protein [Paenibacillus psychroresistens]
MSRLQSIENALVEINETVFQELCDSFLTIRNSNYSAFSRTGSQSGKQKTTVGTPDSFFLLPSGKYIYVEHTTISNGRVNKLINDISKCLDTSKTGVPVDDIEEIILCLNFNLKTDQIEKIKNLLKGTYIKLTLNTLDSLSIELLFHHRDLVHQFLGLPLDSGQIVSIKQFVNEYNKASKGVATQIDNQFLHREDEMNNLIASLHQSDFIILTGAPGVGKTKLAIETIQQYLIGNSNFNAFCISYKNYSLLDDLYQYMNKEKDYILFVDDANRIDAFNQIVGFYKSTRRGTLKVLITVRDYAYQEVGKLCYEYSPIRIDLMKLNDDQIIDIIKSDSFKISNSDYHKEIVRIADGNPRLAIMTAKLAIEKQNIYALSDVSDLFEKYFSTFIKDDGEFSKEINLKCLGLIAFFFTLPYKDKDIIKKILAKFGMTYLEFVDSIDKLENLELVEIQFEHVKIPEQNLSTYFFYKSFIKDNLLSFDELLMNYFENNSDRFKDCIIPANNTFGHENVMGKIKPKLQDFWIASKLNEEKSFKFLSTFWFYLQEETLEFVFNIISKIKASDNIEYNTKYKTNAFSYDKNNIIELLGNFFRFSHNLQDVIELLFEFTRKTPQHLPELIHKIKEELTFDDVDERNGFKRQEILIDILLEKFEQYDGLYAKSFYELSKTFLKYKFHHTKGGRNNTIYWYDYAIPNNEFLQKIRIKIWQTLDTNFINYPNESLEVITGYSERNPDVIMDIMYFDLSFILSIINNHLTSNSFEHCYYVQKQIRWLMKCSITHESFEMLLRKFTNSTYEIFLKIDWDRYRDKESYEFSDFKEYDALKETEIRNSFIFNSVREFEIFYIDFTRIKKWKPDNWNYNNCIEFIIDQICINNFSLGIGILKFLIEKENEIDYIPILVLRNQLNTQFKIEKIWSLIQSKFFKGRTEWEISFYENIDDKFINLELIRNIIETINQIQYPITLNIGKFKRYTSLKPNLFQEILYVVIDKINDTGTRIILRGSFFSDYFDLLGTDITLIKKGYLQQYVLDEHIDYNGEGLINILKLDSTFLLEYIENIISDTGFERKSHHKNLSIIWSIEKIENVLIQALDLVFNKDNHYYISDYICESFFLDLKDEMSEKADIFILNYIRNNNNNLDKMNFMINIIRNKRNHLFDSALLLFISLNQDIDYFSKISWRGNGGSYSGDVIIGDIQAAEWRNILSIVETSNVGIRLIPIKKYISDKVRSKLEYGNWERQRKFLGKH